MCFYLIQTHFFPKQFRSFVYLTSVYKSSNLTLGIVIFPFCVIRVPYVLKGSENISNFSLFSNHYCYFDLCMRYTWHSFHSIGNPILMFHNTLYDSVLLINIGSMTLMINIRIKSAIFFPRTFAARVQCIHYLIIFLNFSHCLIFHWFVPE